MVVVVVANFKPFPLLQNSRIKEAAISNTVPSS